MNQLPLDINAYIKERIRDVLPPSVFALLQRTARLASEHGWAVYLVGGYVRDCLLKIPDYDIDISVVGDALALARMVAHETGARLAIYPGFGTAALISGDGIFDIDIVTARKEWYVYPGALPTVEVGTIEDDLARRDFTVNAMAVGVLPDGLGALLDPHGGIADMRTGIIGALHDESFKDDPTRIFRAVKLAERLGFKLEQHTLELILQAVRDDAISTVSVDRIAHELLLIMEEPKGGAMLAALDKLGVLAAIHPMLSWPYTGGRMSLSEQTTLTKEERRDTYLAVIAAEFAGAPEDAEGLARWLHLSAPLIKLIRDSAVLAGVWQQLGAEEQAPSETYKLLKGLDTAALEAYTRIEELSKSSIAWARLLDYLDRLRHIRPSITGDYLQELGVPQGPIYKHALQALLYAKLDGKAPEREDEEKFVQAWVAGNEKLAT